MRKRRERRVLASLAVACLAAVTTACRQDMHDQPKYKPLAASTFFRDGRASRQIIEGTVARGHLGDDPEVYTGKTASGALVEAFPIAVTSELVKRGQERFDIYCSPCHDRTGSGNGIVARRGFQHPPSYHIERLRKAPPGYFFDVMSNGFGAMQDYAAQVAPADRWAIVAYIRALQRSQGATLADVPPDEQAKLKKGGG